MWKNSTHLEALLMVSLLVMIEFSTLSNAYLQLCLGCVQRLFDEPLPCSVLSCLSIPNDFDQVEHYPVGLHVCFFYKCILSY